MESKIHTIFNCVIPYIDNGNDRNSISLVCRKFYELDCLTRKKLTVHINFFTKPPSCLFQRFPYLESLTLKGFPVRFHGKRIEATPWIQEIAMSFNCLTSLRLVTLRICDSDLELLAKTRGKQLRILKFRFCRGITPVGLLHISTYCNDLTTFHLEDSEISEEGMEWFHELAIRSTSIESLNFNYAFYEIDVEDLTTLAKNCSRSLVSFKTSVSDNMRDLEDFFRYAVKLEEFTGYKFDCEEEEEYVGFKLPQNIRCMEFDSILEVAFPMVLPIAHQLTEVNLRWASLDANGICYLIQRCPNLEVLITPDFGDQGMQLIGRFCKKLCKLVTWDPSYKSHSSMLVSHMGLIALAQGCAELESLDISLTSITDEAMEFIGSHLKNLRHFKMVLRKHNECRIDFPLDNGVRAMLTGCTKLKRLNIQLLPGRLTDVGLGYIGMYGHNLKSLYLRHTGESDEGLVKLSKGCPKLRKLEMKSCPFTEQVLTTYVFNMTSLRYVLVYDDRGCAIMEMSRHEL